MSQRALPFQDAEENTSTGMTDTVTVWSVRRFTLTLALSQRERGF